MARYVKMSLLWITSSPNEDSHSTKYAKMLIDHLPHKNLVHRDVTNLPHFANSHNERLIDEVINCDTLVLSVPMWNYGIPSSVKAWVDLVTAPNRTFHFDTETYKVVGHCHAKVYLVITCGTGVKQKSERDFITPYLEFLCSYLGMEVVKVVWVNNVHDGDVDERVIAQLKE